MLASAATAASITVVQAARNLRDTLPVPGPLPRLFCDIDGTVAFQPEGDVLAVNAKYATSYAASAVDWFPFPSRLRPEQARWLDGQAASIAANLAPDTAAISVLCRAVTHGYPLVICTERSPGLADVTRAWVKMAGIPADVVVCTGPGGKRDLLEPYGSRDPVILFDDSPRNIDLARDGVTVWQPARPYNHGGGGTVRFRDWDDVALMLGLP